MRRIITLTTDFGLHDPFVGIMKGVILGIAPDAAIVDLTHDVPPQDILAGALALEAALPFFPPNTIHVAVVDPGVGSERHAVALETERGVFVGPDNGVFTAALGRTPSLRAVRLTRPEYFHHPVSATFHGRDIFAPVAAYLAQGTPLDALGDPFEDLVRIQLPDPVSRDASLEIHVLHIDRFGNLVTDLTTEHYQRWLGERSQEGVCLRAKGRDIHGMRTTFTDAELGEPVAYIGSAGRLEVGVRNGNAARDLGLNLGAALLLWHEDTVGH